MHRSLQVLFPALRTKLTPVRKRVHDGTFVQLANLKMLYKVFERC